MLGGISMLVTLKSMVPEVFRCFAASRLGPYTHCIILSENITLHTLFDEISSSVFVNCNKMSQQSDCFSLVCGSPACSLKIL